MSAKCVLLVVFWLCRLDEILALGWIFPKEPIYLEENDSFRMQCMLDMTARDARGFNSSNLMFYRADEVVPREQVKILNATTIELTVEHAVPSQVYAYTCKLNDTKGVGLRSVYIGHKPQPIKDFRCRTSSWKTMNCTFTPEPNGVKPHYELFFKMEPVLSNYSCELQQVPFSPLKQCIITIGYGYRAVSEIYRFTLSATNKLGTQVQEFTVNNFDVVVPDQPTECSIVNSTITSHSAVLKWGVLSKYENFKRTFRFEVKVLSMFHNQQWQIMDTTNIYRSKNDYQLSLNQLSYADTRYDVRIRMRTNSTVEDDDMWSNYTSCLFKTLSRQPDNPPDVADGIFENANDHLFLYWRELHEWQHNARTGFYYNITKLGPSGQIIEHFNRTRGMLQMRNIEDQNFTFIIHSANGEGRSFKSSVIFVPSKRHRPEKPEVDKLLSDSGKFTLSWKRPASRSSYGVTSYTVFWCNTTSNSPNDCHGSINFTTVAANRTSFELSGAGSTLNFAVAANAGILSSGMVWAACTATHKTDIGKLKTLWITEMLSTYINLKWKPECGDVAHNGYLIYYCPISAPRTLGCKEPEMSINVTDKSLHYTRLENLKPYVTYKIEIAMYSETHIGPRSEPLVNTTREAAPSPPRNLTLQSVTNDSITLSWKAPEHINSGKMSYEIRYNNDTLRYSVEDPNSDVETTVSRLNAFTLYNISVRALTIGYSNASEQLTVRTRVGQPEKVAQLSSTVNGDSNLVISWRKPSDTAGCVEFYELKLKTEQTVIYKHRGNECQLRQENCKNAGTKSYQFLVRAVNVIRNDSKFEDLSCEDRWLELQNRWPNLVTQSTECDGGGMDNRASIFTQLEGFELVYGPWSDPLASWCTKEETLSLKSTISIVLLIAICVIIFFYFLKMKHICQVKVIIPDGLNDKSSSGKPDILGSGGRIIFIDQSSNHAPSIGSLKKEIFGKEQNQCLLQSSSSSGCGESVGDLSGHDQRSSLEYFSNGGAFEDDSTSFYDQEAERQDLHGFSDEPSDMIDSQMDNTEGIPDFESNGESRSTDSPILSEVKPKPAVAALPLTVSSGYVPAPVAVNPTRAPVSSSGYLQLSTLVNGGGMMMSSDVFSKSANAKMPATPISGYVTHKQLSAYGQHLN
ncbi:cytokine receptor-like isoform X2 [Anopheles albimanus]|uniref:Fibronectin type-III domain-containing protein n=2 Tax=Anopheles albimanus TaxID=7167 RepID=A0A182FN30_ANOAL|nr:cytokine receptor-like isoform X2 [Anopheles albimanus]XP_035795097.1 cytokine receptor-like isoform X2 [Anopheles albimanus]